jgi:hypothetical protein
MERLLSCALLLFVFAVAEVRAQTSASESAPTPPTQIVDQLWTMATTGELLTAKGKREAAALYLHPGSASKDNSFRVVSNFWGPAAEIERSENSARVYLGYSPAGTIDAALRYTPPPAPPKMVIKFAMDYHLVLGPTHSTTTLLERSGSVKQKNGYIAPTWRVTGTRTVEGPPAWKIEGPWEQPFLTVNAAIRYVLEMRDTTKDPTIKQNADKTLAILLRMDDLYRRQNIRPSACACD